MNLDVLNKQEYEKNKVVASTANDTSLQPPEIMILIKYRDCFVDKKIIDIGCGTGRTTFFIKNLTQQYIGIDYSHGMIESCKKRFKNVSFLQRDVRDMSVFSEETFDLALFSFNGLDYISHADRLLALAEIRRVLKKNGYFIFSSHNRNLRDAVSKPKLKFSTNPCKQLKNVKNYIIANYNYAMNKKYVRTEEEYSIINDVAKNYGLLTYYIDKKCQIAQLKSSGFKVVDTYDTFGNLISIDDDDSNSGWIYYVAQKMTKSLLV